jgi:benzodiazapine receptor
MKKDVVRQVVNLLTTIVTIIINGLANALPINGQTTGEISDRFRVYFVPAGYVFSIWGLIYLALIAFAVYQALPAQRENPNLRRIGYLFALSCVANSAWIFLWHYELFELTLVAMFGLLLSLIAIYLRLDIGRTRVSTSEKWLVHIPFSIYLGWITVATIANVTAVLYYLNWDGWGISPEIWAVIMLIVGAGIASAVSISRGDVAYVLVIVWAFVGIAVKQAATPMVAVTAGLMALIVALTLLVGVPRSKQRAQDITTGLA